MFQNHNDISEIKIKYKNNSQVNFKYILIIFLNKNFSVSKKKSWDFLNYFFFISC